MAKLKLAVVVGSNRRESMNRKLAQALTKLGTGAFDANFVQIDDLPMYTQDNENPVPADVARFKGEIEAADAVLFVTPEYNRSVPAVLKNAIDVGSRPYGHSIWNGKPAAVVTLTPGALGGFGANHHLRQALVFLNMPTMQQPEAYIGGAADLFDNEGNLIKENTREFLVGIMNSYARWVEANAPQ